MSVAGLSAAQLQRVERIHDYATRFPLSETGVPRGSLTIMAIPNYRLTPDAQADLIEIRRFTVQQWGKVQSKKYLSELQQTFRLLASTPAMGRDRPDVGSKVLSFPHVSHVIYYIIHERQPVIFGVLHKRMVPANHLDGRGII